MVLGILDDVAPLRDVETVQELSNTVEEKY
jgi:hypothetical protein